MAWAVSPMRLTDEVTIQGAEEFLAIATARLRRNPEHVPVLRDSLYGVFGELWPAETRVGASYYIATISRDIDKIPAQLLEDLVAALGRRARDRRADDQTDSSAAQLTANWLKMRLVEMHSDSPFRAKGRTLKDEYGLFFRHLFEADAATVAELAS